jgi:hypothetical protein
MNRSCSAQRRRALAAVFAALMLGLQPDYDFTKSALYQHGLDVEAIMKRGATLREALERVKAPAPLIFVSTSECKSAVTTKAPPDCRQERPVVAAQLPNHDTGQTVRSRIRRPCGKSIQDRRS